MKNQKSIPSLMTVSMLMAMGLSSVVHAAPRWKPLPAWQSGVNGPSDREHPLFFIPPGRADEAVLYGGLNYPTALARVAIDEKNKTVLVTGGDQGGTPLASAFTFSLEKNLVTWTKLQSDVSLPRQLHSLIKIPGTPYFLAFGGISLGLEGLELSNTTTLMTIESQNSKKSLVEGLLDAPNPPSARYGFASVLDRRKNRVIVTLGQGPMKLGADGVPVSEQDDRTYALNLMDGETPAWQELTNAKIRARRNPCWALDLNRNHLYVFGGTANGIDAIQEVQHRDRILMGFGNILNDEKTAVRPLTDVWALELN